MLVTNYIKAKMAKSSKIGVYAVANKYSLNLYQPRQGGAGNIEHQVTYVIPLLYREDVIVVPGRNEQELCLTQTNEQAVNSLPKLNRALTDAEHVSFLINYRLSDGKRMASIYAKTHNGMKKESIVLARNLIVQ